MTSLEKSQKGLALLKEAVIECISHSPGGIRNSDIAKKLELESDFGDSQKNYLSWYIIGLLVNDNKVKYKANSAGKRKLYYIE